MSCKLKCKDLFKEVHPQDNIMLEHDVCTNSISLHVDLIPLSFNKTKHQRLSIQICTIKAFVLLAHQIDFTNILLEQAVI